ncbi:MAG: hypothetical protein K2W96_21600, partial [Gemmataceae bacterium]|nr:hypothetical protein [Gemmataceae bacterium]
PDGKTLASSGPSRAWLLAVDGETVGAGPRQRLGGGRAEPAFSPNGTKVAIPSSSGTRVGGVGHPDPAAVPATNDMAGGVFDDGAMLLCTSRYSLAWIDRAGKREEYRVDHEPNQVLVHPNRHEAVVAAHAKVYHLRLAAP